MHEALIQLELALRSIERQVVAMRRSLNELARTCAQCGEPLDSIEEGLCAWCFRVQAARDAEVVS